MAQIAFYTFGLLHQPLGHVENQEYLARSSAIWELADATPGYLYPRSDLLNAPQYDQRGSYVFPRWYAETPSVEELHVLLTLTLWADIESVRHFTYKGLHQRVLRRGKEWFRTGEWPGYVIWWVEDGEIPTWQQGCQHLEHLHDHGPTAQAFDFKHPFDANGNPIG